MALSSAAMALRESFGDRSLPDITRKITACVACRKQKIKCHMNDSNPPCRRCKARGLPCSVNKSLQMLLENDAGWKENMEQRMRTVEDALRHGTDQRDGLVSSTLHSQESPPMASGSTTEMSRPESASLHQQPETVSEVTLNLSCSLGSFPGSSITTLLSTEQAPCSSHKPDLISFGLISLEAAEEYFTIYHQSLDPCIYHVLGKNDCLANIRARSAFLTAAVCTVGSFCAASTEYQKCYDAFINEVSKRVFSRCNNFDDVRALCIGAFWLNKVSPALVGLAVRMAADLNLHRCITKMPHTKIECYERTRLYFLVYICDHHCSLIYGRPPMTREYRSLKSPKTFLQSTFCIAEDVKLISQVNFWSISSRVFDIFGADTEAPLTNERAAALESLGAAYDTWHADLFNAINDDLDDFSRQIFDLYAHSAKLYLFSHTFRGSSQRHTRSSNTLKGIEKFQRCALENALSIVQYVAWGSEMQGRLENLPSYFVTMIAFASVSLIKAWGQEPILCGLDQNETSNSLTELVKVFRACSARVHSKHPLLSVAKSLEIAMKKCRQSGVHNFDVWDTADALDNTLFAFDGVGNDSLALSCLGDHNNFLPYPNEFCFDFIGEANP